MRTFNDWYRWFILQGLTPYKAFRWAKAQMGQEPYIPQMKG